MKRAMDGFFASPCCKKFLLWDKGQRSKSRRVMGACSNCGKRFSKNLETGEVTPGRISEERAIPTLESRMTRLVTDYYLSEGCHRGSIISPSDGDEDVACAQAFCRMQGIPYNPLLRCNWCEARDILKGLGPLPARH